MATTALAGTLLFGSAALSAPKDTLAPEFRTPPANVRPGLWWHWVAGAISKPGLLADLDWMRRVGIGGVHIFDVALPAPQLVKTPLRYRTPAWESAFRLAVNDARKHGMTVGVASSPGWSESGGPWVRSEDAMKKLSWSEREIEGGRLVSLLLPQPPATVGPFLDAPPAPDSVAAAVPPPAPLYRDVAVLAVPLPGNAEPIPSFRMSSLHGDPRLLTDGSLATGIDVPAATPWVRYDFAEPILVRHVTVGQAAGTPFAPTRYGATLEADRGWGFEAIARFDPGNAPQQTAAFAPVTARSFRLVFDHGGPGRLTEFRLSSEPAVNAFETKAAYDQATDYTALGNPPFPDERVPKAEEVLDLTGRVGASGRLQWQAPPGRWRLLRMGWTLTGKMNHPAPREATGLEADKLDAASVRRYATQYLDEIGAAAPIGAAGLGDVTIDSIEVGAQNLTAGLIAAFSARRGYDPLPYLPVLAGMIVDNPARSDAFLFDFRRTIGDLLAQAHYGTLAQVARERGLTTYGEAMEFARTVQGDDMAMRAPVDIPMAAMWSFPLESSPEATAVADIRGAASTAHLAGKRLVAAELLTSIDALWAFAPHDLKPMIDRAFALGVNAPILHSSVHQRVANGSPGLTLGNFGQTFNRTDTWAPFARPWIDYIARSALLLQRGRPASDMLYAYGEDAPRVSRRQGPTSPVPSRQAPPACRTIQAKCLA